MITLITRTIVLYESAVCLTLHSDVDDLRARSAAEKEDERNYAHLTPPVRLDFTPSPSRRETVYRQTINEKTVV